MRPFKHFHAQTVQEACALLEEFKGEAVLNAGGTDLLGLLKGECLPRYPQAVINIKTITGLDYVREEGDWLQIGALTRLAVIAGSPLIRRNYSALAEAAHAVATPQIRNMATIGGNLCQDVRCWYYRYGRSAGGPISCARKGGRTCHALKGDNRYHAIMGSRRCFAVCPSDTAVALAALDAQVRIFGTRGERSIAITDFFSPLRNALEPGEMVVSIDLPRPSRTARQRFLKFTLRKPIDFAIVSVAVTIVEEDGICAEASIALGAVAPGPVRARAAEEALRGRRLDLEAAARAAEEAVAGAKPLRGNAYKIELVKALVKRAVFSA